MLNRQSAYARIVKRGGQVWYEIFCDQPSTLLHTLQGPYRDTTDAENAAHEEAVVRQLELEWIT